MLSFTLVTTAIAVIGALVLSQLFTEPRSARAIWTSAALAVAIQIATYALAKRYASRGDVIKGWGIGALIRVTALMFYGLLFFGPWKLALPLEPALMSFALFVFGSTLIEPLFLRR
jgi:hypothetical protein